ncbi:MAG: Pseudopaline exporter CntI [Chlamydiia bacterium]|nr:Pseudopaline exporter CntI [Chlamydiia bacterium]MCH9615775.1 Pseudopaline exporter CntI [Chlamydiia bacterium]MCH9628822.1 Pseudopaline exporter CntI [Chlamydiia bacterium]
MHRKGLGIALSLLASLMIASSGAVTKLSRGMLTIDQILFFRFAFATLYSLLFIRDLRFKCIGLHLTRSLCGFCAMSLLFTTFFYIPVAEGMSLFYLMPFYVPIVARLWSKTPIPRSLYVGIAVAFVGVIFILRPSASVMNPVGLYFGLAAGMFGSVSIMATRYLHRHDQHTSHILFFYFALSTLLSGAFWIYRGCMLPQSGLAWFYLILVGVIMTVYQHVNTLSVKYAPARLITPVKYIAVIFAALYDVLLWNNVPTVWAALGMCLVIVGAGLVVYLYPPPKDTL